MSYNTPELLEINELRKLVKDKQLENVLFELYSLNDTNIPYSPCAEHQRVGKCSTGTEGSTGATGDTGTTGATGPEFNFTGPANSVLFYDGEKVTGSTGFTYIPGGTGIFVDGNIIPLESNTYTLGSPDSIWKGIYIGPGTLTIAGPEGSSLVGTIGTDLNAIVYSQSGFATPFINIGPSIDPLDPGAIGGWAVYPIGTPGTSDYDLVAQQKLPALGLPAGLTGPVFSLLNGTTGSTGYQGNQGIQGETGSQGDIGVTGPSGAEGIEGVTGYTGEPG